MVRGSRRRLIPSRLVVAKYLLLDPCLFPLGLGPSVCHAGILWKGLLREIPAHAVPYDGSDLLRYAISLYFKRFSF